VSPGAGVDPNDGRPVTALVEGARAEVEIHPAADGREERSRTRILEALVRLPHPFDEEADLEHVTGSAVVVGRRGTVLHRHKRLGRWLQPGGHLEPGEGPWDAALRESEEETGLSLLHPLDGPRLLHLDVHEAAEGHIHLDFRYLLLAPDEDPTPPPGESPEARWYSWEEALAMADDALLGALDVARKQPEALDVADRDDESPAGGAGTGTEDGAKEGR
jgi:8-oxo-dGTP pyrophosphatase MutT (NUDIX family)